MEFKEYQDFKDNWTKNKQGYIQNYISDQCSFIPNLLPEEAIELSTTTIFKILHQKLDGHLLTIGLNPESTVPSPIILENNTNWIKKVNMVGINVRTIGSFWNIVKYALTLPKSQSSIHVLPIWEVGVVASLYGISSWNINPEFFDEGLYRQIPTLNTVEKQLKVTINILHAMGKTVGMDVIPHTDRYSQIVLANPHFFEWLQRKNLQITNHRADLHETIQTLVLDFLVKKGTAIPIDYPKSRVDFFYNFDENDRLLALFGKKEEYGNRLKRRNDLIQFLYNEGFEPVPATMAPPYRGLKVSEDEMAKVIDKDGRIWRDYEITNPQKMSRVFGPLTRFKLYERLNDNQKWAIDFDQPRTNVWEYISKKYGQIQSEFNFDFMRGDMSHVQMRPEGVPKKMGLYYDILKHIKNYIQTKIPYFGYFAETFLAPANEMAYGDEIDHLEHSDADTTLGDLQSLPVDTAEFQQRFRAYLDIGTTRKVSPNFTIMTADKDDPRFDHFYLNGNEARFFMSLFLENIPSYMGLGFECRDVHHKPASNEHYTKLYVFQIDEGPKSTNGKYIWGKNIILFQNINRIRLYAEEILPIIQSKKIRWLLPPDATGYRKTIAWTTQTASNYLFVVHLDSKKSAANIKIPSIGMESDLILDFSTLHYKNKSEEILSYNQMSFHINELAAGECRVYKLTH
jgi:hypothetical protein